MLRVKKEIDFYVDLESKVTLGNLIFHNNNIFIVNKNYETHFK